MLNIALYSYCDYYFLNVVSTIWDINVHLIWNNITIETMQTLSKI